MPRRKKPGHYPRGPGSASKSIGTKTKAREENVLNTFELDDLEIVIAAAQLRLVTDRRLGKTSPSWVIQLASIGSGE